MTLCRNNPTGKGKYAVLPLKKITPDISDEVKQAIAVLEAAGLIEYGLPGTEEEFFVLKLKDRFSRSALLAYAEEADKSGDVELAEGVFGLSATAGVNSPFCKFPD